VLILHVANREKTGNKRYVYRAARYEHDLIYNALCKVGDWKWCDNLKFVWLRRQATYIRWDCGGGGVRYSNFRRPAPPTTTYTFLISLWTPRWRPTNILPRPSAHFIWREIFERRFADLPSKQLRRMGECLRFRSFFLVNSSFIG